MSYIIVYIYLVLSFIVIHISDCKMYFSLLYMCVSYILVTDKYDLLSRVSETISPELSKFITRQLQLQTNAKREI